MTQIELIKAEIERLKEVGCPLQKGSDYQHGYDEFYTQIKKFIDSLPSEESSKQLCWNDMTEEGKSDFFFNLSHQIQIEKPSEDLEKEIDKQWNEEYRPYDSGYTIAELSLSDYKETARHFAQWQKEQIINKASKWLNENVVEYHPRKGELRPIVNINAFHEAMEKEDEQ